MLQLAQAPGAQRRHRRQPTREPEHAGQAQRRRQHPATQTAEHARQTVADHGVERLATAAQPARKVVREQRDADGFICAAGSGGTLAGVAWR